MSAFPLGKLPADYLAKLLARAPVTDERVLVGPGTGLDCAVIDLGERCLVLKSDPITFATDQIGWYAVQVNANDLATSGADPRWMLATLLLPEGKADEALVEGIFVQLSRACAALGISLVGGHTEVTYGLDRPVISATMVGEVAHVDLVTPAGAQAGDRLLLSKGVPVEAVALLSREFASRLEGFLTPAELAEAQAYLFTPGISVTQDARIARGAGRVTAMHDPTEGGLASALWELAEACGHTLMVDPASVLVPALAQRICAALQIDPLASIASGALLMAVCPQDADAICTALQQAGIPCAEIGYVGGRGSGVLQTGGGLLPRPARDEVARLYERPQDPE